MNAIVSNVDLSMDDEQDASNEVYSIVICSHCFKSIVSIVDLSMDDEQDASDEVSPNSLCMISPRAKNVDVLRYDSMHQGRSLCMELDSKSSNSFLVSQWKLQVRQI